MKYLKAFLTVIAADFLSLFVSIPFAASSDIFLRLVSLICTAGVLICMMINLAVKTAREDCRLERAEGKKNSVAEAVGIVITVTLPAAVSWVVLMLSATGGNFDFYRLYKLINAPFLQFYNLIESDASSAALSTGEVLLMLPTVFAAAAAFAAAYTIAVGSEKSK